MTRNVIIGAVILAGLVMTGLVIYNYFFYETDPQSLSETRGETAILTNKTILSFGRGAFVDKRKELHPETAAPTIGYLAPDFELPDAAGKPFKLSALRGQPVFLNFWASWCPPCRKEMPHLQAFHATHKDKIHVIGVNWAEQPPEIRKFLGEFGVTYPNLIDSDGKVFVLYQLTGLPSSFFVDENGVIRGIWLGPMTSTDIEIAFEKTTRALEEPSK